MSQKIGQDLFPVLRIQFGVFGEKRAEKKPRPRRRFISVQSQCLKTDPQFAAL
jgi:hypothetical protein